MIFLHEYEYFFQLTTVSPGVAVVWGEENWCDWMPSIMQLVKIGAKNNNYPCSSHVHLSEKKGTTFASHHSTNTFCVMTTAIDI